MIWDWLVFRSVIWPVSLPSCPLELVQWGLEDLRGFLLLRASIHHRFLLHVVISGHTCGWRTVRPLAGVKGCYCCLSCVTVWIMGSLPPAKGYAHRGKREVSEVATSALWRALEMWSSGWVKIEKEGLEFNVKWNFQFYYFSLWRWKLEKGLKFGLGQGKTAEESALHLCNSFVCKLHSI